MNTEQEKIIEEILTRLSKIEEIISPPSGDVFKPQPNKQKTMTEIVRGKNLNGQQKVLFVVGYNERYLNRKDTTINDIKKGWKEAKFNGSYAPMVLTRALKEGIVSDYEKNGQYTLTQSGETLFDSIFS